MILVSDKNLKYLKSWLQHHVRPGWLLPICRHTSDHLPPWRNNKAPVWLEIEKFFDFLLHHLKLRLSVWLVKAELLSWHSVCKAGTSLSNALRMGKHNVLEIFDKKHSSACAGFQKHSWAYYVGKRQITIYWLAPGFHHLPPWCSNEGTPVWRKNSSSTFCCTISSLDCRFGWQKLSFSAGTLSARQAMLYQLPVLATLCGWGSILCSKYIWQKALKCWCSVERHSWAQYVGKRQITINYWLAPEFHHLPPWRNNEGTSLEKE